MSAAHPRVPINQMTILDCLEVLENSCEADTAREVAFVLRRLIPKFIETQSKRRESRRTIVWPH